MELHIIVGTSGTYTILNGSELDEAAEILLLEYLSDSLDVKPGVYVWKGNPYAEDGEAKTDSLTYLGTLESIKVVGNLQGHEVTYNFGPTWCGKTENAT